jgi:hypothetical protein
MQTDQNDQNDQNDHFQPNTELVIPNRVEMPVLPVLPVLPSKACGQEFVLNNFNYLCGQEVKGMLMLCPACKSEKSPILIKINADGSTSEVTNV